jgi:hypothetical protein
VIVAGDTIFFDNQQLSSPVEGPTTLELQAHGDGNKGPERWQSPRSSRLRSVMCTMILEPDVE